MRFSLRPVPPFRLDLTAWVMRRVPVNEMDHWDGRTYSRVLVVEDKPVEVSVVQTGPPEQPELIVTGEGPGAAAANETAIASTLTKMLGLQIDLAGFYQLAECDTRLSDLIRPFVGFKPPRLGSIFEALINGVACQQISLVVGITLLNRLCAHYGLSAGSRHAFPRPQDLVTATEDDLRKLGFSGRKAQYIIAISQAIVDGELDLEGLARLDDSTARSALCQIHGVGRWTAEYVELRGLGRLDVYPADDVGNQGKLQHWLNLSERPDYGGVHKLIDAWAPYRGLIYFYLLLDSQARQGLFPAQGES